MSDHDLTQRYYDGDLAVDEEAAALRHLAGCAACQAELAEWMAIDAAAGAPGDAAPAVATPPIDVPQASDAPPPAIDAPRPPAPVIPLAPRRRRAWIAAPVIAAAAALVLWWATRPGPRAAAPPTLALAPTRAVEIRVADPQLDRHRPLSVERGAAVGEAIPLAALAALEARAPLAYEGALLLSRDLERARAAIERQPAGAARDTDLAALALLGGDPIAALDAADRALAAGPTPAARWNRALALRDLGLARAAAAELDTVAAVGEPGWSDEARALAAGLRGPLATPAAYAAFQAAEAAMLAGGPPIPADVAARFPGEARVDLHDALRAAASADAAGALAPLAAAIDGATGGDGARRAVARVVAADFAARARFAPRYRQLVQGQLDPAAIPAFLDELGRAGPAVADLTFGAIVLAGAADARADQLAALARADGDPWFTTYVERGRAARQRTAGELAGAEATLRAALAACPPTVAYRCGGLGRDLASLYLDSLRLADAAPVIAAARAAFVASGTPLLEAAMLAYLGDLERMRTRFGAMQAYLDEARAAAPDDCERATFIGQLRATAAYWRGDAAATRAALPAPDACGAPPSPPYVMVAVDLARLTGDAGDRARAADALARVAAAGDPESQLIAAAGQGRLAIVDDPAGGRAQLGAAIAAAATLPGAGNPAEFRVWAYSSLIDDAGARGEHAQALADALAELGLADPGGCLLAVSLDDDRVTAVARGVDGALRGHHGRTGRVLTAAAAELVPAPLRAALASCPAVRVIARPPLHGRADLLPPATAWSFLGRGPSPAAQPGDALIIRDATPPSALRLPRVGVQAIEQPGDRVLAGAAATPTQVLAAMASAAYIELHVHGLVDLGRAEASFLALSPEPDGRFALTAADLGRAHLAGAPVVVLAACRAAAATPLVNRRWSLPDAFLAAGARTVIAAAVPIPDDQAAAFFASLRARLAAGASPAAAVAAERLAGPEPWRAQVMVFE
ncbi:MAG: CHAT domain-containing protein [Myxococcales bacterium]|nr:CHAT domain-containing protein [Myxococcales bacterium]